MAVQVAKDDVLRPRQYGLRVARRRDVEQRELQMRRHHGRLFGIVFGHGRRAVVTALTQTRWVWRHDVREVAC